MSKFPLGRVAGVMMKHDRRINSWIRERLIPLLAMDEADARFSIVRPTGSFFMSDLFFATIHSSKCGDKTVAVKLPLQNPQATVDVAYDASFDNEILIYNQIACNHVEDYPKCYIAGKDPTFNVVIVLEDVRPRGYSVSPRKVNVDLDYVVAGLRSIGRFHAHTFTIKDKEPAKFHEILRSLRKDRYIESPINTLIKNMLNGNARRLARALRAKHLDSEFTVKIGNVLESAYDNVMLKYVEPMEPLATIVHADCTVNNMLFRKKSDGQLEAMLIDFGLAMYSSPVLDVTSFLYLTCRREDIRDRLQDLFSAYHDSLSGCMKEQGSWDLNKYSREVFWQEYRERAIFGFIGSAVFFRFVMNIYERDHVIPEMKDAVVDKYFSSSEGQDFVDMLIDMLDDLRVAGMLDHLIEK